MTALPVELDIEGAAAPPRTNGELLFDEPWESRVFAMTVALHQAGCFPWSTFQAELVSAIARWEAEAAQAPEAQPYRYYTCWLRALESLLERLDVVDAAKVKTRIAEHQARPPGHDHSHHE